MKKYVYCQISDKMFKCELIHSECKYLIEGGKSAMDFTSLEEQERFLEQLKDYEVEALEVIKYDNSDIEWMLNHTFVSKEQMDLAAENGEEWFSKNKTSNPILDMCENFVDLDIRVTMLELGI